MTTEHPADPADHDPAPSAPIVAPPGRRRFGRWSLVGVLAIAAVLGVIGAALIRVPYYALAPGSVRPTGPLIDLGDGSRDPDAGELAFATVSVDGRVNLLQALSGWLDDAVDVVPEERILQGQSPQETDRHNQVLMADSKELAIGAALSWLGYARPVGAEIAVVVPGSPAEPVLEVGDVVVAVDGAPVRDATGLVQAVRSARPGATMVLGVRRGGTPAGAPAEDVTVVLATSERDPSMPMLGVNVRDAFESSYPGEVTIESGTVGGPSAGLAFTLGIIDLLSEGDLTGGAKVAATGTITTDGRVGPVGGIEQKAAAVRRSGSTLFLVPDSLSDAEITAARRMATGVEIVPVGSLEEALDALAAHGGAEVAMRAPAG